MKIGWAGPKPGWTAFLRLGDCAVSQSRRLCCEFVRSLCASVLFFCSFFCACCSKTGWAGFQTGWTGFGQSAQPPLPPFFLSFPLYYFSLSSVSSPADDAFSSWSLSLPHLKSFQYPLKSLQNSWRKVVDSILSSSSTSSPLRFGIFVKFFTDRGNFISSLFFTRSMHFLNILRLSSRSCLV